VLWSHYFTKLLFYKPLQVVFKHLLENLMEEIFMTPLVSQNYLQKPYSLIWNSFQLHHDMIIIEHLFTIVSLNARMLFASSLLEYVWWNDWCDFLGVLDLQMGMWPNLYKIHQIIWWWLVGICLQSIFKITFQIKPLLNIFLLYQL
jgi:hypothetical protein